MTAALTHYRANRAGRSSRRSLTWSAHNAGGECRNSNVKGDAAETGLQNGNGRIRRPEAPNPGEAALAGRCGELRYFGDPSLMQVLMDITPRIFPARTGCASPAFHRPVAGIVDVLAGRDHVIHRHAGSEQTLMSISEGKFGDFNQAGHSRTPS